MFAPVGRLPTSERQELTEQIFSGLHSLIEMFTGGDTRWRLSVAEVIYEIGAYLDLGALYVRAARFALLG